jgi:hypothetical protein
LSKVAKDERHMMVAWIILPLEKLRTTTTIKRPLLTIIAKNNSERSTKRRLNMSQK